MTDRLVVVGASLAGLRAVEAARAAGHRGPITLVGAEPHPPYDRPPLSKAVLDGTVDDTALRAPDRLAELDVELRLGEPATGLDARARVLGVGDRELPYGALVVATGSRARRVPGALALRTRDDAAAVRAALDAGGRVVVIGAGFIGAEVAGAARRRGLPVTIVEAAATPLVRALGAEVGAACALLHERNGVDLRLGTGVLSVSGGRVRLTDGAELPADVVVAGIGADPETGWLAGSGLALDNGVVCDATLRASEGVYAAGDVARWPNPLFAEPIRLEHWTNAAEHGAAAAKHALDPASATPVETVPYFWSDWYGARLQFVGIPAADEVVFVGAPDAERFTALYRAGDRLVGAFTLNQPGKTMKYRRMIACRTAWTEAAEFAGASRTSRRSAPAHARNP